MFDQAQRQRTRLSTPHVITILLYVYIYLFGHLYNPYGYFYSAKLWR